MLCSISHRVPTDPVVAKTTGCLFERSLIECYLDEHGRCPVTGEPLAKEDLIPVRADAAVGGASSAGLAAVSVPGLLERMRAEWDGIMLEHFTLRQQLAQQQQELAHALQQHEAACRVIARMAKENEALRRQRQANGPTAGDAPGSEGDEATLTAATMPASLSAAIDQTEADQQAQRKQRRGKEMSTTTLSANSQSFPMDDTGSTRSAGATCVAVLGGSHKGDSTVLSAGFLDNQLVAYSLEERRVVATGAGHIKPIHTIAVTQDASLVVSAAEDATVRVWQPASAAQPSSRAMLCEHTLRYASGVSALSRRIIDNRFIFSGSRTGSVYLSDITTGEHVMISEVRDDDEDSEGEATHGAKRRRTSRHGQTHVISAVELHPYTKLGAVGTEGGELFIWNVKDEAVDTAILLPNAGAGSGYVCSLDFSLDCVTLAAGLSNGHALVWDLRRIEQPVADIAPAAVGPQGTAAPASVAFDAVGGSVLAVGSGAQMRVGKPVELAEGVSAGLSLSMDGTAAVRGVAWGPSYLAAAGVDGVVKVFGDY